MKYKLTRKQWFNIWSRDIEPFNRYDAELALLATKECNHTFGLDIGNGVRKCRHCGVYIVPKGIKLTPPTPPVSENKENKKFSCPLHGIENFDKCCLQTESKPIEPASENKTGCELNCGICGKLISLDSSRNKCKCNLKLSEDKEIGKNWYLSSFDNKYHNVIETKDAYYVDGKLLVEKNKNFVEGASEDKTVEGKIEPIDIYSSDHPEMVDRINRIIDRLNNLSSNDKPKTVEGGIEPKIKEIERHHLSGYGPETDIRDLHEKINELVEAVNNLSSNAKTK